MGGLGGWRIDSQIFQSSHIEKVPQPRKSVSVSFCYLKKQSELCSVKQLIMEAGFNCVYLYNCSQMAGHLETG